MAAIVKQDTITFRKRRCFGSAVFSSFNPFNEGRGPYLYGNIKNIDPQLPQGGAANIQTETLNGRGRGAAGDLCATPEADTVRLPVEWQIHKFCRLDR
ncbi:hypothetical protein [Cloacibacillus porcorum]|uniref:hypothetical protein n=1 Tax=Cloacibacillus porcorum TaxID=1197717 RepID=UPI0023557EFB|nr:hypothetical protein [Cloacibacillus porcorum]